MARESDRTPYDPYGAYGASDPFSAFFNNAPSQYDEHGCTPTTCRCVGDTLIDRAVAIREYVQPGDVRHLIRLVPAYSLPCGYSAAGAVAQWVRDRFADGAIRYIDDPPGCDRWGRPSTTLQRGGGDCDDLAILVAAICRAMGLSMMVVVGIVCDSKKCGGHAWVEGTDEAGGFMIEATSGDIWRGNRPARYARQYLLTPESATVAPEYLAHEARHVIAQINAAMVCGCQACRRAA